MPGHQQGYTKYSANAGLLPLRKAIGEALNKETGQNYDADREIQ